MKISYLTGITRRAGGLYVAVSALGKALTRNGVHISVLGRSDPFVSDDASAWQPLKLMPYWAAGPMQWNPALPRLLEQTLPDLVHLHGLWLYDQWSSFKWQKRTKRPVVVSPHGMLDSWALNNSAWKKKIVGALFANKSLDSATCLHALCASEAEAMRSYGLKNPITIIPNGVELPEIGDPIRGSNVLSQQKRLLFLGRIHPKKGVSELISGWHKAKPDNWELLIAGWDDGGHEAGLKAQVEKAGLKDSVAFVGPQHDEEKKELFRSIDAFVLPSFSEGLPMAVLEAWSYRLPVIMTDFCNLPEGFAAGAAIRVDPEADSIAGGLMQLSSMSAQDLTVMGYKGRALVERDFTWNRIAQEMKAVYEWCLGGDKPACVMHD